MADTTVTTLAVDLPEIIADQIALTAHDMAVMRPLITEVDFSGPGDILDLLTLDAMSASSYTEGAARTYAAGTPTQVQITPAEIDVAMSFTDKARKRTQHDMVPIYATELARAVATKVDADIITDMTANGSATDTDEGDAVASMSKLLTALGVIRAAAKDQSDGLGAVLHTSAWSGLVSDSNVINAEVRGTAQGALGGSFTLAGGATVAFTTGIGSSGGTPAYDNLVFSKRACVLGWKRTLEVDAWDDRDNKAFRIAAGADYDTVMRFAGEAGKYTVTV